MKHLRRAGTREIVLGVLSVLVIGSAAWYLRTHWMGVPPAPDGQVGFYCPRCQHHYTLTNQQFDVTTEKRDFVSPDRGLALFQCPKCKQYVAQRAEENETPSLPAQPQKG